jgi:hypothetical protein
MAWSELIVFSFWALLQAEDRFLVEASSWSRAAATAVVGEFRGGSEVVLRGFPCVRFLAEEEGDAVRVDVGHVHPHRVALGIVPRFVQVSLSSARMMLQKAGPSTSRRGEILSGFVTPRVALFRR